MLPYTRRLRKNQQLKSHSVKSFAFFFKLIFLCHSFLLVSSPFSRVLGSRGTVLRREKAFESDGKIHINVVPIYRFGMRCGIVAMLRNMSDFGLDCWCHERGKIGILAQHFNGVLFIFLSAKPFSITAELEYNGKNWIRFPLLSTYLHKTQESLNLYSLCQRFSTRRIFGEDIRFQSWAELNNPTGFLKWMISSYVEMMMCGWNGKSQHVHWKMDRMKMCFSEWEFSLVLVARRQRLARFMPDRRSTSQNDNKSNRKLRKIPILSFARKIPTILIYDHLAEF